jgi:CheY-like chemotaxis protein
MTPLAPVILIVEDEFLLRLDSAETIESAGFEVIQAANADEAIAILKARPDIHVVFTDIQMPGSMDGLNLARFRSRPLAADQDSGDLRSRYGPRRRFAGRQRLPAEAVSRRACCRDAARANQHSLITAVPAQSPS